MKKIVYFLEFILIKVLFILFQIIGYRLSSNLGFFIGKTIGSIFRSKKRSFKIYKRQILSKPITYQKLPLMCLVIMEEFLQNTSI